VRDDPETAGDVTRGFPVVQGALDGLAAGGTEIAGWVVAVAFSSVVIDVTRHEFVDAFPGAAVRRFPVRG
jgi:hypothetical protein